MTYSVVEMTWFFIRVKHCQSEIRSAEQKQGPSHFVLTALGLDYCKAW